MKVEAGQIRIWKKRYFQLTAPTAGYERFLVIREVENGKWTVMFPVEMIDVMTEESILKLTDVLE